MTTRRYGRLGHLALAAMIAFGHMMLARGQVESQNIVGYNTVLPESSLTDDDFCYTLANGIATIMGYTGTNVCLVFPETVGGHPVGTVGGPLVISGQVNGLDIDPNGAETNSGCFACRIALERISLPSGVTNIDDSAFYGCASLTDIRLPPALRTIGQSSFSRCVNLQEIRIPASVELIGSEAFSHCHAVKAFSVAAENQAFKSDAGVLFSFNGGTLIQFPTGSQQQEYSIPQSVGVIGASAFACAKSLTGIRIPSGVTRINSAAFLNCRGLTSVIVPANVVYLVNGNKG